MIIHLSKILIPGTFPWPTTIEERTILVKKKGDKYVLLDGIGAVIHAKQTKQSAVSGIILQASEYYTVKEFIELNEKEKRNGRKTNSN